MQCMEYIPIDILMVSHGRPGGTGVSFFLVCGSVCKPVPPFMAGGLADLYQAPPGPVKLLLYTS